MSESFRRRLRALPDFPEDLPEFDPSAAPADPVTLFHAWLDHALTVGVPQPHAFSLATADARARVSSRMLILKDIDDGIDKGADGADWLFASARSSRKGQELAANPQAAMNFYWPAVGRQVRLLGPVTLRSAEESARDWAERPATDGSGNPEWQLYALRPTEIEFWQARHDRHHVRHRYGIPATATEPPARIRT